MKSGVMVILAFLGCMGLLRGYVYKWKAAFYEGLGIILLVIGAMLSSLGITAGDIFFGIGAVVAACGAVACMWKERGKAYDPAPPSGRRPVLKPAMAVILGLLWAGFGAILMRKGNLAGGVWLALYGAAFLVIAALHLRPGVNRRKRGRAS